MRLKDMRIIQVNPNYSDISDRIAAEDIKDPFTDNTIVPKDTIIKKRHAREMLKAFIDRVRIYNPHDVLEALFSK